MRKKEKAAAIIKLLKKGMTPKEVRDRIGVSYNYAWKLKKDLEKAVDEVLKPKPEPEVEAKAGEYIEVEGAKSVDEIDAILNARGSNYGSFMQSSDTAIRIKGTMHSAVARNAVHLYPDQLQALDMIATKISRIVHGNPNHTDSWIDIAGYATLVADRLQGKTR